MRDDSRLHNQLESMATSLKELQLFTRCCKPWKKKMEINIEQKIKEKTNKLKKSETENQN